MIGYVIEKVTRKILIVVGNVISASDTHMTGVDSELRGIDPELASVVVSEAVYEVGETLPESVTDSRAMLLPTQSEYDRQRLDDVTLAIADLYSKGVL